MSPVLRRACGAVVLVVMGASAGYSANYGGVRDALPPPAARLQAAAPTPDATAAAPGVADARPALRSLPWWQPVAPLEGTAGRTTELFTIARDAIQWRVTWRCESGTFRVRTVVDGKAGRDVVRESGCADPGIGYSVAVGPVALEVEAAGRWTALVEQQVDIPKIEPPLTAMTQPGAVVRAAGSVYDVDRTGRGRIELHRLADGRHAVRLVDFSVSINSDLEVRLSRAAAPRTTSEAMRAPYALVAPLEATAGSMNFVVPSEVDVTKYRSVVIWCEITHNAYAAAALRP